LVALMLVGIAAPSARGVSSLVAAGLLPSSEAMAANHSARPSLVAANPVRSLEVSGLVRNAALPPVDVQDTGACEGVRVVGIVQGATPEGSLALVNDGSEKTKMVTVRSVLKDLEVVDIAPLALLLRKGDLTCVAHLGAQTVVATPAVNIAAKPEVAATSAFGDLSKKIVRRSDTEFTVERGARDQLIEGFASIGQGVRILPEMVNGKQAGFRLGRIAPNSPLRALGLQEGDRLERINGAELTDTESVIAVYARLRSASELSLGIVRGGRAMAIDYRIE